MEEITLNEEKKTEQEFLEMAKDCMERIESKNHEIKTLQQDIHNIESQMCEVYGCFRKLSKYVEGITEIDPAIDFLMREINHDLHQMVFHRKKATPLWTINIDFNQNDDDDDD